LITSRCSNDSTATVLARAAKIVAMAQDVGGGPVRWCGGAQPGGGVV